MATAIAALARDLNIAASFAPAYRTTGPDSTESHRLLDLLSCDPRRDLDDVAIRCFLRTGVFLGDTTPFKHIKSTSAVPRHLPDLSYLGKDDAIDGYIRLFRKAVERCIDQMRGPAVMGLSGGRDSWHIALELHRAGVADRVTCFTVDLPHSSDFSVVQQYRMPYLRGMRHLAIMPLPYTVQMEVEKNRLTNLQTIQHGFFHAARSLTITFPAIFDGNAGDHLSEVDWTATPERLQLLDQGRIRELARTFMYGTAEDAEVLDLVEAEFRRYLHLPNPIKQFILWNRARKDLAQAPFGQFRGPGAAVLLPYLDDDLFVFLSGLRPGMILHTATIARAFPNAPQIYSDKQPCPSGISRRVAAHGIWQALKRMRAAEALRMVRSWIHDDRYAFHQVRSLAWWVALLEARYS